MNRNIAFCGIACSECKAFVATRENDEAKRREIAEEWKIKPEEVNCDGCVDAEGRHISYWDTCEIRKCGTQKEVDNCACCRDYACEKLEEFHKQAQRAKKNLDEIRKT